MRKEKDKKPMRFAIITVAILVLVFWLFAAGGLKMVIGLF